MFARFDTAEFNRLPSSINNMYDDAVFADQFRYQLTMFEVCILIGLSRLIDTHVAYELGIKNMTIVNWIDAVHDLSC